MDADVIFLSSVGGDGGCGVRSEDDGKRSVRHNNQISGVCPHYDVHTYVRISNVSKVLFLK